MATHYAIPSGSSANTFTLVGAASAHQAVDDPARSPTAPTLTEYLNVPAALGTSQSAELTFSGWPVVGSIIDLKVWAYLQIQANTASAGSAAARAELWDGTAWLNQGNFIEEAAGTLTTGWYSTDFYTLLSTQTKLSTAKLKVIGSGDVALLRVHAAYIELTYGVPVSAASMVAMIKEALYLNPGGVVTVTVDGQTVTYSRETAIAELKFWQQQAASESSTRPRVASVNLQNSF